MMCEKQKAFDELYIEKGIEEGDITAAANEFNLFEDEGFQAEMKKVKNTILAAAKAGGQKK